MDYKILSKSQNDQVIVMEVEYNLVSTSMTTSVSVFTPATLDDIHNACVNRGISEQARIDSIAQVSELFPTIVTGEVIEF
jgi:hypothetical protein